MSHTVNLGQGDFMRSLHGSKSTDNPDDSKSRDVDDEEDILDLVADALVEGAEKHFPPGSLLFKIRAFIAKVCIFHIAFSWQGLSTPRAK